MPAASPKHSALPTGFELNEYRIESTLGVGGFGLTYLATDTNLNLRVAVKEYLPGELALRGEDRSVRPKSEDTADTFNWGLSRFLDESRTLASFRHPNIVRVMRYFRANNTAYMVMEFVEGRALPDWIRANRPVSEIAVRTIAMPLLDGLGVVHRGGYLHRDIKPGNVFIREDGSPVLLDFGSARMAKENTELTAIVTPGYAPLEQYHTQGRQGPWTDLYAFGGVLYWMITGSKPVEAAARIGEDPMTPALQAADREHYSSALLTAIDWMLSPSEKARPQAVGEVIATLRASAPAGQEPLFDPSRSGAFETPAIPAASYPSRSDSSRPTSAPFTTMSGVPIDRDALKKMEAELITYIGPIAPVVIRSAAKSITSLAELANVVAQEIPDDAARVRFIRRFSTGEASHPVSRPASRPASGPVSRPPSIPPISGRVEGRTGSPTSGPTNVPTKVAEERFEAKVLNRAEALLAQHIGPLARVVVKRAALKARDVSEFYLLLADEIDNRDERKAFVRRALAARD